MSANYPERYYPSTRDESEGRSKIVEPEPRTDAQCTTPSQVGEDFTDSVCSGTPLPAIPKSEESHHLGKGRANGSSDQTMANEVEIELVVWLVKMKGAVGQEPLVVAKASVSRVFCSSSWAFAEPVAGLALAERFTERTRIFRACAMCSRRGKT